MKKIVIFLMVLCVFSALVACGEPEPTENLTNLPDGVSYGIKVVDGDGNPIAGAMVVLCQNVEGGICYMPGFTGEDGMALFKESAIPMQNNMKVRVLAAEGYELPLDDTGDIRYTLIPDGTVQMILVLDKIAN